MRRVWWVAAVALMLSMHAQAAVWYVDIRNTSTQDGKSWAKAFRTIQQAIDAAANAGGGEVWVAQGTYGEARTSFPHGAGQNTGSLMMRTGVAVYGGFAGNETTRSARNAAANPTIIDGSRSRNNLAAYHVVVGAEGAVLDGFIIRGGNANGGTLDSDPRRYGGGLFNLNVAMTIANCTFTGNTALIGGGAVYNEGFNGTITGCRFDGNTTGANGGGGAILQFGSAAPIRDCIIVRNKARWGGGIYLNVSSPTISGCSIGLNEAVMNGGGVFHFGNAGPTYQRCSFWQNKAVNGAGTYGPGGASFFVNCIFQANTASGPGGGVYNTASPDFMNCTFADNAGKPGGAMFNATGTEPEVTNSILWDNGTTEIGGAAARVSYSDVEGGYAGTGNINQAPKFLRIGDRPLRLAPGSPCLDRGTADNAPNTDANNLPRPFPAGGKYDMGAYEGPTCVLTTEVLGGVGGVVDPAPNSFGYFIQGTKATVKATPNAGWRFVRWEGSVSGTQTPLSVTMNGNMHCRAVFAQQFTLTMQKEGEGTVQPAVGTQTYDAGSTVTVSATPATGWRFAGWQGSLGGTQSPVQVVIDGNKTIKAVFVQYHTLTTAIVGSGTVNPAPGDHIYDAGASVPVTATPADGWRFVGWQGDASGTDNPLDVAMDADKAVTAVFEQIPVYTLRVERQGSGSVEPEPGTHTYLEGTEVELVASPSDNWTFTRWEGDVTGTEPNASIVMDGDKTVRAVFSIIPLTISDPTVTRGLTLGGTVIGVTVGGWTPDCTLYVGEVPCMPLTNAGAKAWPEGKAGVSAVMRGAVPPMAVGQYPVKVVKPSTGQQATADQTFEYTDDPFRDDLFEDFDAGVEIEDGSGTVTTYAIRAYPVPGVGFPALRYESPEGLVVEVPGEAIPSGATAAYLLVRTSPAPSALVAGVMLPPGMTTRSVAVDAHLLVPSTGAGLPPATEYREPLATPAVLMLPVNAVLPDPSLRVGWLDTTLNPLFAPEPPVPVLFAPTDDDLTFDAVNRATIEVDRLGAHVLMGEGPSTDINGDGTLDAVDIQLCVNGVLGLDTGGYNADVNGDGSIDAVDVQVVVNAFLEA
jgi:hypothetical protein